MLALPVSTMHGGFIPSLVYLVVIWVTMTLGAFLILEVNLWFPPNSNLVTMARSTLGRPGALIVWVCMLALLYCLLSAYIAGGSDLVSGLLSDTGVCVGHVYRLLVFVIILGGIVSMGIKSVDWVNRFVMLVKLTSFSFILLSMSHFIHLGRLTYGNFYALASTVTVMVTSFGYAIIIPSLRGYFKDDIPRLRKLVFIGSLIPLACYLVWELVIFGAIKRYGHFGLESMGNTDKPISALLSSIVHTSKSHWVLYDAKIFTSICIITAFLGVSICLVDFLTDGLQLKRHGRHKCLAIFLSFTPPVILVILWPKLFIYGLSLASIFCVILLVLLPVAMAAAGRKRFSSTPSVFILHPVFIVLTAILGVVLLIWSFLINVGII